MIEWKDVLGYEGIYEVSRFGKIRSKEGKKTYSTLHGEREWKQRILKQKKDKKGYCRVTLYKDLKHKDFLVHRLVAIAFCLRMKDETIVNHLDGNPSNNNFTNLDWCTYKENSNHAFNNGLMKTNNITYLVNFKTKEVKEFRSLAKASLYLKKNRGYLSALLKNNKYCIGNHHIF